MLGGRPRGRHSPGESFAESPIEPVPVVVGQWPPEPWARRYRLHGCAQRNAGHIDTGTVARVLSGASGTASASRFHARGLSWSQVTQAEPRAWTLACRAVNHAGVTRDDNGQGMGTGQRAPMHAVTAAAAPRHSGTLAGERTRRRTGHVWSQTTTATCFTLEWPSPGRAHPKEASGCGRRAHSAPIAVPSMRRRGHGARNASRSWSSTTNRGGPLGWPARMWHPRVAPRMARLGWAGSDGPARVARSRGQDPAGLGLASRSPAQSLPSGVPGPTDRATRDRASRVPASARRGG